MGSEGGDGEGGRGSRGWPGCAFGLCPHEPLGGCPAGPALRAEGGTLRPPLPPAAAAARRRRTLEAQAPPAVAVAAEHEELAHEGPGEHALRSTAWEESFIQRGMQRQQSS